MEIMRKIKSKILVVDDNEINRLVVVDVLKNAGFEVEEAKNGEEAVKAVNSNRYDLVLMDINMPVMDGYEAAEILRKKHKKAELPVVALTSDVTSETKSRIIKSGMNDYLEKPIDRIKSNEKLSKWLQIKDVILEKNESLTDSETVKIFKTLLYNLNVEDAMKRINYKVDFYINMLIKFAEENMDLSQKLSKLFDKTDYNNIKFTLHSLKGVAAYLGAEKLLDIIIKIRAALNNGLDEQKITLLFSELDNHLNILFDEISIAKAMYEDIYAKENDTINQNILTELINNLFDLTNKLDSKDKDIEQQITNIKKCVENKNIQGMLDMIKSYADANKFDKAKAIAKDVIEMLESLCI